MRNMIKLGILVGVFLLSIIADATISLGSSSDVNYIRLEPGSYGVLSASFFNMGEEQIDVRFEVEYPSDLRIEVFPTKLTLNNELTNNPTSPGSWLILDGGKRYVKTYPVDIYVKTPTYISRSTYKIKLIATATGKDGSGGEGFRQSMAQVREVMFTVYVPGRITREETEVVRKDASYGDGIKEEAKESLTQTGYQGGTSAQGGSEPTRTDAIEKEDSQDNPEENRESPIGITRDEKGNTDINLPTGKISLSNEQTETAIDVGLITLIISVASLMVRVLK
jgi:hypothetical protein